ncbi:MAG: glycoside hydrolase family 3 N-terminal domain-containing protein [Bacteroidota bacterium]|jgi:beta-glucosidase
MQKNSLSVAVSTAVSLILSTLMALAAGGPNMMRNRVIEKRIDSLLSIMTVEEKLGQLNQKTASWDEKNNDRVLTKEEHERVKRGDVGSFLNVTGASAVRKIQKIAVEESRLHIPLIFGLDVIHGYRTVVPIPLGEACTWDPVAVQQSARIAATEASACGINWTFAPMVDIARDPRWGRIAEGSGEDPYLGCIMAAARVKGFQTDNILDSTAILACVKHFAAYGGAEAGRDYNTVDISERTLREVYLPPYRAAVKAGAGSVMSSFNEIAGVPSTANPWLLATVLRDEWKFEGFVVSDWTAIEELQKHGIAGNSADAGQKALTAGIDMDMMSGIYRENLPDLVRNGAISMAVLDEAVRRVLRMKYWLGLFDSPYKNCQEDREKTTVTDPAHRAFARKYAAESMVLLKNQNHLLPLNHTSGTIAIVGWLARSHRDPLGPWHCKGRPEDVVTVFDGLHAQLSGANFLYAQGYDSTFVDSSGFGEALRVAGQSDVVVVVAGEHEEMSGEAASRSDIGLPAVQRALLERLSSTGKPIVLILMNGRPLTLAWEAEHIPAILETWFAGVEAGNAAADVVFGAVNPGGKLVTTFPRSTGQIPLYYNHKNTGRPASEEKYTSKYLDVPNSPLFPFGYGLSYTRFEYGPLNMEKQSIGMHDTLRGTVTVSNAGDRSGDEVVQIYIHDEVASITRPVKELKGFLRIHLEPGERKPVEFAITPDQLSFYNEEMRPVTEPGTYTIMVGPNSEEVQKFQFELRAK